MSIMGREFDEAAAKLNAMLAKLDKADILKLVATLNKVADNLLEVSASMKVLTSRIEGKSQ